jgi:ribosomal protein L24E
MAIGDTLDEEADWQKHCIVCGKSVLEGEGYCHMRVEGEMVAICCPLCFETFEKNPKHYLGLRRFRGTPRKPKENE